MGKGGLNRVLLPSAECVGTDPHAMCFELGASDSRSVHIRTLLAHAPTFTLRVAVEPSILHDHGTMTSDREMNTTEPKLHDTAIATVLPGGMIRILVPLATSRNAPPPPPIALLVAMQRPKVIGRVLEAAAAVGVSIICIVAAEKVEKSYWDCKLFRDTSKTIDHDNDGDHHKKHHPPHQKEPVLKPTECPSTLIPPLSHLPGRPRGIHNHPHRDRLEMNHSVPIRVDGFPAVRRRLREAVQQASVDATLPVVLLERRGLSAIMNYAHPLWKHISIDATRVVTHPYSTQGAPSCVISRAVARGSNRSTILAIGPEGGWVEEELRQFATSSFTFASLGPRILRSETATIIGLGLVHEGFRLRDQSSVLGNDQST